MGTRPKIKIEPDGFDKIIEAASWMLMAGFVCFAIYAHNTLPDTIPIHFDASGRVDGHGGKASLLALPGITLFIFLLLSFISGYPHYCNYPVEITEQNAEFQYRNLVRLLRMLKLIMIVIFGSLAVLIFCTAKGMIPAMGIMPLLVITILPIVPIIYYVIKMKKGE